MSETRFVHIPPIGKLRHLLDLPAALAALQEGGILWIDFFDPVRADLTAVLEPLGLHPLSIEDCLDEDQIPKIDLFPSNTFILFNGYDYNHDRKRVQFAEVDFFLGKNFLITVSGHGGGTPLHDRLMPAVEHELESARQGPDFLLHVILDTIVDRKFTAIEQVQEEIDAAEEVILKDPLGFKPELLMHLRRELLSLRKSLFHEREILVKICRRDSPFISEKAIYHFRDIYDHLAKFFEVIEMYREMITSLMEMYLSMINNHMARVANRTNRTVRRLTFITTIFMPLTLLSGIFGMSEWSMMTGPDNWTVSYPLFFALLVVVAAGSYFLLKRSESKAARHPESRGGPFAKP